MAKTHGGRKAKSFEWALNNDYVVINNENNRREEYSLTEITAIVRWLTERFGNDWFPLANDVEKLWHGEETDGLGIAILSQQPRNVSHAQGSSYLGVVLEEAGILVWNNRRKGIQWRIVRQVQNLEELRRALERAKENKGI